MPTIDAIRDRSVVSPDGCWQWQLGIDRDGYGRTYLTGRTTLAHRLSYELVHGRIPAGLEVDHLCRNRSCVNPEHLEAVTHAENMARSGRATQTHCQNGHEYTPENTRFGTRQRFCRACDVIKTRRYRERKASK